MTNDGRFVGMTPEERGIEMMRDPDFVAATGRVMHALEQIRLMFGEKTQLTLVLDIAGKGDLADALIVGQLPPETIIEIATHFRDVEAAKQDPTSTAYDVTLRAPRE